MWTRGTIKSLRPDTKEQKQMSSKRVKQYLMLLTAIGLIAIASGGGSGTFASFTAEVHNPGNTFATGSLYLHDSVTNLGECTSESAPLNSNTTETPGDSCDTLFTVPNSTFAPNALLNASGSSTTYPLTGDVHGQTIDLLNWNGGATSPLQFAIPAGSEIEFDNGTTTDVCAVNASGAAAGAATVTLGASCDLGADSYGAGTIISSEGPFIAHLTLRNAGTIDGKDLEFALDSHSNAGGCDQTVDGLNSSTTLCGDTNFTITEVNKNFTAAISQSTGNTSGGLGCAYGTAVGSGCTATSHVMTDVSLEDPTSFNPANWTSLNLASLGGTNNTRQPTGVDSTTNHATGSGPGSTGANPGTGDTNPGGARYFLVEIWPGSLTNDDMGGTATFDLIWHMDQA
jgi:predicted ribosomally synthesized peptide with SipW-like signal peptide